jgi:large subunit ribosomal protein L25
MLHIDAKPRDTKGNLWKLRKGGEIPAIYYGPGAPSTPVSVNAIAFDKLFKEAGESSIIALKTPKGQVEALIHDVAHDPVTGVPVHIDFYLVAKDRMIEVNVPVEFVGAAPAERVGGAVVKVLHEIRVEALPANLPQHIVVDLSVLENMDSHVSVKDLVLPAGVRVVNHVSDVIVSITKQHEEKEEVAVAPDLTQIEVEKKGKKEEEAEGEAAA